MAVGDVINNVASVPPLGNLDFQPAVGVEVAITMTAGENAVTYMRSATLQATMITSQTNTIQGIGVGKMNTTFSALSSGGGEKMLINNNNFLRLHNSHGTLASTYMWCGVQIK